MSRPWALVLLVFSVAFTAMAAVLHVVSFRAPALDEPETTIIILVLFVTLMLLWIPAVAVVVERAKAARLSSSVQEFTGLLFRGTPTPVRSVVLLVLMYAFLNAVLESFIPALHSGPIFMFSAVFLAFSSLATGIFWGAAREAKRAA